MVAALKTQRILSQQYEVQLGLSKFEIDECLDIMSKGATDHYLNNNSNLIARDIQQMEAIEKFEVIHIVYSLVKYLRIENIKEYLISKWTIAS